MAPARSIAVAQTIPIRGDVDANVAQHVRLAHAAAREQAQVLGAFSTKASCDGVVPPAEATVFHPGNWNPLVRFGGNTAAVAVCADTGRPSHPQDAADRGARTYLASMFVIPSEFERETANLRAYAAQHSMIVAFANYGGPSGGLASGGRSAIWSESGELLAQLGAIGAGVAVAIESHAGWRAKTVMLGGS